MSVESSSLIAILAMTPVFSLAAFGELLDQRSGVYNLGIEGIMSVGAAMSVVGAFLGLNSWGCILLGTISVLPFGALLGVLSERYKLNQLVVGFGLWLSGLGLAGSIYSVLLAPHRIIIEKLEPILFDLDPIFYLSIALVLFLMFFFSRTKLGLVITAVGQNPKVADSAGINVERVRITCTTIGSGLMGLAGAYLAIDILQGFTYGIVAGYGWIAFALVIFGRWKPSYVFLGSLLFVGITGIATRLQILGLATIPSNFVVVLPHIGVLVVLTLAMKFARDAGVPGSLGQPYVK
jgi:general nucleoside transport system permease protein